VIVPARTEEDLDALAMIATEVQHRAGYPVRFSLDLRAFVETSGALAAWVAEDDRGAVVGHVALNLRSSPPVVARVCEVLGHDRIGVVARLLVAPAARRTGIATQLLRTAADEARARSSTRCSMSWPRARRPAGSTSARGGATSAPSSPCLTTASPWRR
jgi:GNAT superfamily N-acetyltransferase